MYIFVVRFLLISVMKLVEGAIYYLIEYVYYLSLPKISNFCTER